MAIAPADADYLDLLRSTTQDLPHMDFRVAFKHQRYEMMGHMLREDRIDIQSGTSILRDVQLLDSGAARHVRMYQKSASNVVNTLKQVNIPWRHAETQWPVERREILMNRKPSAFVNLVKSRRTASMHSMANVLEERAWLAPASSADETNPSGIPYYIVKAASNAQEGFLGLNAPGFNDCAGLDSTTAENARWRNWVARGTGYYTAYDQTLLTTLRRAFLSIQFEAPPTLAEYEKPAFKGYAIYTNLDASLGLYSLAIAQNDNVGYDLFANDGTVNFYRVPVQYVPFLAGDATDPIYFVNKNVFGVACLTGDYLYEHDPIQQPEQHNVFVTFIDLTYNFYCDERWRCAVVSR